MSNHFFQVDGRNLNLERIRDLQKCYRTSVLFSVRNRINFATLSCCSSFPAASPDSFHNIKDVWSPKKSLLPQKTTETLRFSMTLSSSTSTIFTQKEKLQLRPSQTLEFQAVFSNFSWPSNPSILQCMFFPCLKQKWKCHSWAGPSLAKEMVFSITKNTRGIFVILTLNLLRGIYKVMAKPKKSSENRLETASASR